MGKEGLLTPLQMDMLVLLTDGIDINAQSLMIRLITSKDVLRASAFDRRMEDGCSHCFSEAALFRQVDVILS
eukprot:7683168-Ditylum_brightwellii.AAC.1